MIKKELLRKTTRTETNKGASPLVAWVILVLTLLPTFTQSASAVTTSGSTVTITQDDTVAAIKTAVEEALGSYTTVTVLGTKTDADATLTLDIPSAKKVQWKAVYEAASGFTGTLITLSGTGSTFEVATGGVLNAQNGIALYNPGAGNTITVSGGAVSGNSSSGAIYNYAFSGATVLISGGTVSGTSGGATIYNAGKNINITVSGGTVTGSGNSYAIAFPLAADCTVTVTGGTLIAQRNAIFASVSGGASNITVNVSGGTLISSNSYAIDLLATNSTATVSGGVLFGRRSNGGTTLDGVVSATGGVTGPTGTGTIILWGGSYPQETRYKPNATNNLYLWPAAATAKWDIVDGKGGISFVHGAKSGFIEAAGAKVLTGAVALTDIMTAAEIKTAIEDNLYLYDTVTVTGGKTGVADTLTLAIPAGKTVLWSAAYEAAAGFDDPLIDTGDSEGTFELGANGVVFGYGADANSVVAANGGITGTGVVIAWDKDEASAYDPGDATDLSVLPAGATAVWAFVGGEKGVSYANGANTGFVAVAEVNLSAVVDVTDKEAAAIQAEINSFLEAADTVRVIGYNLGVSTVALDISAGKKVVWDAEYLGVLSSGPVIELTGGGEFEVSENGILDANGTNSSNYAIYATGGGVIRVSGGYVNAPGADAILASNANARIYVEGGEVVSADRAAVAALGGSVTVSGGTVRSISSYAVYTNGVDSSVSVTGGTVRSGNYIAIQSQGNVTVSGGTVTSPKHIAIAVSGSNSWVDVSGGTVESAATDGIHSTISMPPVYTTTTVAISGTGRVLATGGSPAIDTYGSVFVSDDAVVSAQENTAILSYGDNVDITVSGGARVSSQGIDAITTNGDRAKIEVSGNAVVSSQGIDAIATNGEHTFITVSGDARVSSQDGCAIFSNGEHTFITVSGDARVSSQATYAIVADGSDSTVTVSGGVVSTQNGRAIYAYTGGEVIVNGGTVLGRGTIAKAVVQLSSFAGPTDTGLLIAWESDAPTPTYLLGSSLKLATMPDTGVTAVWATVGGQNGIAYANGGNTGFVETTGVTLVSASDIENTVNITGKSVAEIEAALTLTLAVHNTVTVTGSKTGVDATLALTISAGKRVVWQAVYEADGDYDGTLIRLLGAGTFEVAAGGALRAESATALYADDTYGASTITVSGGAVSATSGIAIHAYGTVTVSGGAVRATGDGWAIHARGVDSTVTVSGGTVSATTGYAIYSEAQDGGVTVSGGTVSATSGEAIRASSQIGTVTVSGGTVSATSGSAIRVYGNLTVSDGTVYSTTGRAVYAVGANSVVTVSGGRVQNEATIAAVPVIQMANTVNTGKNVIVSGTGKVLAEVNAHAIATYGSVDVEGNAEVSSNWGYSIYALGATGVVTVKGGRVASAHSDAIILTAGGGIVVSGGTVSGDNAALCTMGENNTVTVSGGTVTGGIAILTYGANSTVTVTGGRVISFYNYAILAEGANTNVTVSGGFVYGLTIAGVDAIYIDSGLLTVNGAAVVVAWDINAGWENANLYLADSDTHLAYGPAGASAVWTKVDSQHGISYANGANTGFLEIPGVTVFTADEVGETVSVTGKSVAEIQTAITNSLLFHDTVTVTGSKTEVDDELVLAIPAGKTVVWEAVYEADRDFYGNLVNFQSAGTFEVAAGGTVSSTDYHAIYVSGDNSTVTVSGGAVSSTGYYAIAAYADDITILVSGGAVSAYYEAIDFNGENSIVEVSGGVVTSQYGMALYGYSGSNNAAVTVSGGVVRSLNNTAVLVNSDNATVTVSGGLVFSSISDANSVIYCAGGFAGPTETGVVLAWDKAAAGEFPVYGAGKTTDLTRLPSGATVVWAKDGAKSGISYTNGGNTGFIEVDGVTVDGTPPVLTEGTVSRTSDTAATIGFTTDEAGTAYYLVVEQDATAPTGEEVKDGTSLGAVAAGDVSGKTVTLTAGAKDIYVVVEDAAGNISAPLKIEAAAYDDTPTGINSSAAQTLQAISTDGGLQVRGLVPGEVFSIYNLSGQLVYNGNATAPEQFVPLNVRGIYIVASGNQRIKTVY